MIYEVSVAGEVALKRLETEGTFTVHSVFNNGMNLISNDQLVFVGTNKNGYFPFGLVLSKSSMHEVLQLVKIGDTIKTYNNEIRHRSFSLMLNNTEILKNNKEFKNTDIITLYNNIKTINFSGYNNSDFDEKSMRNLLFALKSNNNLLEKNLRFFIGRGQGLTPTGDDIITGILYADAIQPFIHKESFAKIEELYKLNLTTIVSQQFVLLALEKIFSSKITDLHEYPTLKSLESLVLLGSTSGLDTLYGIYQTLKQEWYE